MQINASIKFILFSEDNYFELRANKMVSTKRSSTLLHI